MKITPSKFEGIFWIQNGKKRIATVNLVPGFAPFGEQLIKHKNEEYRVWNPYRSKWAAAIMKGVEGFPLKAKNKVLYLGAASGQGASYIADIVGDGGKVFCVEISPRVMRDLIFVAEKKENMVPILADAAKPEEYEFVGKVDLIFQDVAVKGQVNVLVKNKKFLKRGGYALIAIKSRSIDVSAKPSEIFKKLEKELEKHFSIIDKKRLEPFEMDHLLLLLRQKN